MGNLTIMELLTVGLILFGMIALGYLISVLRNTNKMLIQTNEITEANLKEIDTALKQLPEISEHIHQIASSTKNTLDKMVPEIEVIIVDAKEVTEKLKQITDKVNVTTNKVSGTLTHVTDKVSGTVTHVTGSVNETTDLVIQSIRGLSDYTKIVNNLKQMVINYTDPDKKNQVKDEIVENPLEEVPEIYKS